MPRRRNKLWRYMMPGMGILGGGFSKPIQWLLRDEFTTDDAAPVSSPRTCEPGPGTLTVVQNDGQFSITSGYLTSTGQATPTHGDLGFYSPDLGRALGRACLTAYTVDDSNLNTTELGFVNSPSARGYQLGHFIGTNKRIYSYQDGTSLITLETWVQGTEYIYVTVQRNAGAYYFIKGGAYTEWLLQQVKDANVDTVCYYGVSHYDYENDYNFVRVADLPAPFNADVLHLRDTVVAASDTFTHPQRCVIEFDLDTLPSTGTASIDFREVDADNEWIVNITSTGSLDLYERVDGTPTKHAAAAAAVSNGDRIAVQVDGDNVSGWVNGVHAWTWPSATTFQSYTDGTVRQLQGGSAISDLDIYELGTGVVTESLPGSIASGTGVQLDADFSLEFTLDTLPTGNVLDQKFRYVNSSNWGNLQIQSNGTINLQERIAASTSTVASSVAAAAAGAVIRLEAIGRQYTVLVDGVQKISYASGDTAIQFADSSQGIGLFGGSAASDLTATSLARHTPPGIATQSVLAFPVVGQVFEHEADFVMEWMQNALPSGGGTSVEIRFRIKDEDAGAEDYWRVRMYQSGTWTLDEIINGAGGLTRINGVGALSGGERCVIIASGSTITLYADNTQVGTYASATNYATETDARIASIASGGIISNLIKYQRTLSGTARTVLNKHSA